MMKSFGIRSPFRSTEKNIESYLLGFVLFLIYYTVPKVFAAFDNTIGVIDQSIWILVVLSFICFFLVVGLSWFTLKWTWASMGLPALRVMVLQFKDLELWVQLGFYLSCFALLLLAGVFALVAVM